MVGLSHACETLSMARGCQLEGFSALGAHWEWASRQVSHFPNGFPGDKEAPGIGKAFLQGVQQM